MDFALLSVMCCMIRAFRSSSCLTRRLNRRLSSSSWFTIFDCASVFLRLLKRDLRDDSLLRIRRKSLLLTLLLLETERRVYGVDGPSLSDCAEDPGLNESSISSCCCGRVDDEAYVIISKTILGHVAFKLKLIICYLPLYCQIVQRHPEASWWWQE